ncbi:MAG: MmcQ/YjbR family DNA-binding protein [Actinobacteria bacterium]|nr:MmcQ/YjbR family DNA-binding protein [Actinomycetota bacterium]OJU84314.1 MAG: hypothetical protein BGO11_16760 [Solirubrobacterales bacterium 70-9]
MATWDDVAAIAAGLADVEEGTSYGNRAWKVKGKLFVWERPLRKKEVEAMGGFEPEGEAPTGEILGARVPDEGAKRALVESEPEIYFTTPHFDGHASVLIRLDRIGRQDLEEAIAEAWHSRRG